jgi:hypothetical protein
MLRFWVSCVLWGYFVSFFFCKQEKTNNQDLVVVHLQIPECFLNWMATNSKLTPPPCMVFFCACRRASGKKHHVGLTDPPPYFSRKYAGRSVSRVSSDGVPLFLFKIAGSHKTTVPTIVHFPPQVSHSEWHLFQFVSQ